MTSCEICFDLADVVLTWVNSPGKGKGAGVQGAAMCDGCAGTMWHKLGNYPGARDSVTIYPAGSTGARAAMAEIAEKETP